MGDVKEGFFSFLGGEELKNFGGGENKKLDLKFFQRKKKTKNDFPKKPLLKGRILLKFFFKGGDPRKKTGLGKKSFFDSRY